jgi:cytochrome d ubiquinol oxidase subunit II
VFGVAFGNLFQGVPFHFDDSMRSYYTGSFWALLNPMALLFGVVSLALLTLQGATFLAHRTEGALQERALKAARLFALVLLLAFCAAGFWVSRIDGYVIKSIGDVGSALNPMMKEVVRQPGAWFGNYQKLPLLWLIPALGCLGAIGVLAFARRTLFAFVASSVSCLSVIFTAGVALFPFVLPSSSTPAASLTAWDACSSYTTLNVMFWVALIFTPIVLAYTGWAYHVMAGKVTREYIGTNDKSLY